MNYKHEPDEDYYEDPQDRALLNKEREAREDEEADRAYDEMKDEELLKQREEYED